MRINNWKFLLKNINFIKNMSKLDLIISIFYLILFSIILFYIINHISYININLPIDIYSYINSLWSNTDTNSLLPYYSNNLLPDYLNTEEVQHVINYFIDKIISVLEPITVTYSNKLLADQIYFISIVLFIMSILVTGLILFLFLNIVIFTFSDKLLNLFTNKYVRWYININKKFIGIEICFMGVTILYGMINISYGLHFIATHPIIFS